MQGCDVELTEVKIVSQSGTWWTLGFEAFGDIDTVPGNLTLVVLPDCSGPGSLNRFSASLSGVSAGVRLPCGWAAG